MKRKLFITILIVTLSVTFAMAQQSSWKPLNIPANGQVRDLYMLDENVGFAIVFLESGSPNSLLFKTLDGGETWDTLFFSNYFNKMFVFSEDLLYICANN